MPLKNIHLIAAARPNFMKIAPLYHALVKEKWANPVIVHTGQHYDLNMSQAFFRDLRLPEPAVHLGVGSGSHAFQDRQRRLERLAGRAARGFRIGLRPEYLAAYFAVDYRIISISRGDGVFEGCENPGFVWKIQAQILTPSD